MSYSISSTNDVLKHLPAIQLDKFICCIEHILTWFILQVWAALMFPVCSSLYVSFSWDMKYRFHTANIREALGTCAVCWIHPGHKRQSLTMGSYFKNHDPPLWEQSGDTTKSKNLEELLATEVSRTMEKALGDGWTELGLYARCFLYSNSSYWAATAVFLSESVVLKRSILCPNHYFLPHTMKKKVGSLCVSLSDEIDWLVWMLTHD